MNRAEMIDELLERLEAELDELTNGQLSSLLTEYEHSPMLVNVVESLSDDDEDNIDEEDEDEEEEELPLVDEEWLDETDEE